MYELAYVRFPLNEHVCVCGLLSDSYVSCATWLPLIEVRVTTIGLVCNHFFLIGPDLEVV